MFYKDRVVKIYKFTREKFNKNMQKYFAGDKSWGGRPFGKRALVQGRHFTAACQVNMYL